MNKKGFTLIELVVSIAILSVVMVEIVTVFSSGFQLFAKSSQIERTQFELRQYAEGNYDTSSEDVTVVKESCTISLPNGTKIDVIKVNDNYSMNVVNFGMDATVTATGQEKATDLVMKLMDLMINLTEQIMTMVMISPEILTAKMEPITETKKTPGTILTVIQVTMLPEKDLTMMPGGIISHCLMVKTQTLNPTITMLPWMNPPIKNPKKLLYISSR